jgi:hypothetical protein
MSPLQRQVDALAEALPDRNAAMALAALGFENVFALKKELREAKLAALQNAAATPGSGLRSIGETPALAAFALTRPDPIVTDAHTLRPPPRAEALGPIEVSGLRAMIPVAFESRDASTFRHPDPLAPSDLVARWTPAGGVGQAVVLEESVRALLPVAVAPEGVRTVDVDLALPRKPGSYRVTLARRAEPDLSLGARTVRVVPLEAVYPPLIAMKIANPDFVHLTLLHRTPQPASRPRSVVSLAVARAHTTRLADAMRSGGGLAMRWFTYDRPTLVATTSVTAVPGFPIGEDAQVDALVPALPPDDYLVLVFPIAEPDVVLLGGVVTLAASASKAP